MTTATLTASQFCNNTFKVLSGETILPVYIYRNEIGGGEFTYSVKEGDVSDHAKGETLAKGFESRKLALGWIVKNVK
jgi:hypothetical protein